MRVHYYTYSIERGDRSTNKRPPALSRQTKSALGWNTITILRSTVSHVGRSSVTFWFSLKKRIYLPNVRVSLRQTSTTMYQGVRSPNFDSRHLQDVAHPQHKAPIQGDVRAARDEQGTRGRRHEDGADFFLHTTELKLEGDQTTHKQKQ